MGDRSQSQFWEPEPRYGACSGVVNNRMYLWGGMLSPAMFAPTDEVNVFDIDVLKWMTKPVAGTRPPGVYRAATASIGHFVFSFGGLTEDGYSKEVVKLDTCTFTFAKPNITNAAEGPMEKCSCGMIAVSAEILVVVGGYSGNGHTSEVHALNIKEGMWSSPAVDGEGPPPCAGFTLTVINKTTAAMFGRYQLQPNHFVANLYLLDFVNWHWSVLPAAGPPKSWPRGRDGHTAFPLLTSELNQHCCLAIACGWGDSRSLSDLWVMNITEHYWEEVTLPEVITPRYRHAGGIIYGEGARVHLVLHGGLRRWDYEHPLAATTVIDLVNKDSGWEVKTVTELQKTLHLEALYRQSLSYGFIESSTTICLFSGAAGAGKTHMKHLVCNRPSPLVRHSTPLTETPIRAFSCSRFDRADSEWHEVDENEQVEILGARMASGMSLNEAESLSPQLSIPPQVSEIPLAWDAPSSDVAPSNTSPPIQHSNPPTVHSTSNSTSSSLPDPLQSSIPPGEAHPAEQQSHTELVHLIGKNPQPKKYRDIDWVLIFDTGGQPAFHEIISLFFPEIAIILFVTNLSERLDQHPKIKYFSQGRQIGRSYASPLTNLKLFQHSFRAIQSQTSTQEDEAAIPKMIVVGTHRDQERRCSESRREKNRKLMALLSPEEMKHTIFYSLENEEIIHPVNAKKPKEVDQQIARIVQKEIVCESAAQKREKTPIKWHVLEQSLRKLARAKQRGILSRQECLQEVHRLHLSEEVFEATLEHFIRLNTLLYYRHVLPQVIFVEPQPLLDKITELIKCSHELRGTVSSRRNARSGIWLEFRDTGIITLQHLQEFPRHYIPGLFTPSDLLRLLEHKRIIAPVSEGRYFMPSLLPELKVEEASKHRIKPSSSLVAPLAITFLGGIAPRGLFCSMVASLLSPQTPPFLELLPSSNPHHPQCVSRNYIKFTLPNGLPGSLTLVDAYTHFEVHLNTSVNIEHCLCSTLKTKIFSSIQEAATALHYHRLCPQVAFLCEDTTKHAEIEVIPDLVWWQRWLSIQPRAQLVTPPPHVATTEGKRWRCSLAPDKASRELEGRHLIWLRETKPVSPHAILQPPTATVNHSGTAGNSLSSSAEWISPSAMNKNGSHNPDMMELINFQGKKKNINIAEEIGIQYSVVGTALLNDHSGAIVPAISEKCLRDPLKINMEILRHWVQGKGMEDRSWQGLIGVLRDSNLCALADNIEEVKGLK